MGKKKTHLCASELTIYIYAKRGG